MAVAPEASSASPLPRSASREQMRARYPDETGFVERNGVRVFYEVYGTGEPTILLLPTWSIIHSRFWKPQIAYLARHYRVITFDGRGNGKSDRPQTVEAYAETEFAADALAVLDATSTKRAVIVSLSAGAHRALILASDHPEHIAGAIFTGPSLPLATRRPRRAEEGWNKYSADYWRRDYRGFLEFFFGQCFSERHSTKQIEDSVGWGLDTDPETLILTDLAPGLRDRDEVLERCAHVRCPVLVIHGSDDHITTHDIGAALAGATRGRLLTIDCGGHIPSARDPVLVNLAIRDFVEGLRCP
jgi:pimeloyl-ACP methyl ester carboxylesterase